MTRILLVRHGQSEWNAVGRWQGQADPPLSDLGREQAFAGSQRLGTVDAIVSSDLQRAMHTAQILSGQLGVGPVVIEPLLRERHAGEWSGLTTVEIEEQWPGYLESGQRPPGFEADESLLTRTLEALANIEEQYRGGEVLVVAHGGLVYALEREFLPGARPDRLPNLAGRWLTMGGERNGKPTSRRGSDGRDGRGGRIVLGERLALVDEDPSLDHPAPAWAASQRVI